MILHKYLNSKYGIDAMLDSELKTSVPTDVNDPFEFLPKDIGEWTIAKVKKFLKDKERQNRMYQDHKSQKIVKNKKEFKKILKEKDDIAKTLLTKFQLRDNWDNIHEMRERLSEFLRLISFSSEFAKTTDEILMWSHYGNNHTGYRLHYDSELIMQRSFELKEIEYSDERPKIDYTLESSSNKFVNQIIQSATTKAICWEYEKEYRLLIDPEYCTNKKNNDQTLYFAKIPPSSLLRVDLGLNSNKYSMDDIKDLSVSNRFKNIAFFKAELNKNNYKLDYVPIN